MSGPSGAHAVWALGSSRFRRTQLYEVDGSGDAARSGWPSTSLDVAGGLVEQYWERTNRFSAMVTTNRQDAADVAQEAMERIVRKLDRYSPSKGSFDAWLWRIVVNTAKDAGRASTRRASLFERLVHFQRGASVPDAESMALQSLTDQELLRAVSELNARPRTVIALRFGAQLSFAEIAEQIGISEAAAAMATRRALDTLRRRLQEKR